MTINLTWLIAVAVTGGVAVAVQAQMMGVLDKGVGTLEAVFITYGSGALLVGLVMLAVRGGNLSAWQGVPGYALLSGIFGLVIVGAIGFSAPRLGLVAAMTVIVAAQFLTGAVLEHYGLLGAATRTFEPSRLLGIVCLLGGTWLLVR